MIKQGFLNDKNEPQIEQIFESAMETFPESGDVMRRDIIACTKFDGTDPCQQAFEVFDFM